jgi:hypothetical protein
MSRMMAHVRRHAPLLPAELLLANRADRQERQTARMGPQEVVNNEGDAQPGV